MHIAPPAAKLWHLIHFQDGSRGGTMIGLLPVSYLVMALLSEDKNPSASLQIWSTYTNLRLRHNYFRFGNNHAPYRNYSSSFSVHHRHRRFTKYSRCYLLYFMSLCNGVPYQISSIIHSDWVTSFSSESQQTKFRSFIFIYQSPL